MPAARGKRQIHDLYLLLLCICICIVFVMCSERERGEYLLEEEGKIYAGTHSKPRGRCHKDFK